MQRTVTPSATVLAVLVVAGLLAGTAVAVSVANSDVPEESKVGDPAEASATITDLYEGEGNEEWTLVVNTELENTSWTIEYLDQTDSVLNTTEVSDRQAITGRTVAPPVDEIRIRVTGTTPPIEEFEYESDQTYVGLRIGQRMGGTEETVESWEVVHYTQDSRSARQALDAADQAIQDARDAGASVDSAVTDFENAVQAYNGGNFELAQELANDAERKANDARQSDGLPILPIAGGVVVLVALAGGGIYYYRQQQRKGTKLR